MRSLLFFLILPLFCFSQNGYYTGLSINTGYYRMYNYTDWHSIPNLYPQKCDLGKFYNYSIGVVIGKNTNDRWNIELGLNYKHFRQDYVVDLGNDRLYDYYSQITYFNIEPMVQLNLIRNNQSEIRPNIFLAFGPHINILNNYYENGYIKAKFGSSIIEEVFINNNGNASQTIYDRLDTLYFGYHTESIYSSYTLGFQLALGLKINLNDRMLLRTTMKASYDFTNTENLNASFYNSTYNVNANYFSKNSKIHQTVSTEPRTKTCNESITFGFSFIYYLKRQSY